MSATNRGSDRIEDDFYRTPAWCVHRLLEEIGSLGIAAEGSLWHEVTAGDGAIIRAANEFLGDQAPHWAATELRDYPALREIGNVTARMPCDYLTAEPVAGVSFIITNPPFSIAEDVIKKALSEAAWVAMLVRTNFKSGPRSGWLRNEMPDDYQLPDRPSFIASYKCKPRDKFDKGCGWEKKTPIAAPLIKLCPECGRSVQRSSSDSAEYSWYLWTPERGRTVGRSRILASTPAEQRKVIREAA